MGSLGWPEILMILVVALIIFGPRKLPELGKTIGQSLAQFRRASEDFKRTWEEEVEIEKRRIEAPPRPYEETYNTDTASSDHAPVTAGTGDSDTPDYWSENASEQATEKAEAADSMAASTEDSIEVVPAITPDTQAVPRQTKRDWM
jgi:TatA/E family protein of Tat protein translocase